MFLRLQSYDGAGDQPRMEARFLHLIRALLLRAIVCPLQHLVRHHGQQAIQRDDRLGEYPSVVAIMVHF